MSQKELLYLEDAIGHEKNIICILEETIKTIEDKSLVTFLKSELKKHTTTKDKLMNFLEDKSNE